MPETELLTELTQVLGPVGGFLAFIAIGAWWYISQRQERKDNGSREETRENIRVIRKAVERNEERMDRHLEQHSAAD